MTLLLLPQPGVAQDRNQDRDRDHGPAVDPRACGAHERIRPGTQGLQARTEGSGNLSDKLARTDGVLCPPNVDPDIWAPTPENGRMPVIPPPGGPGGDPSVRPK